jgi:hypothetical protein
MEKKNNKYTALIITILVIALVGCAFYIGTTMNKNTNQSQSTSTSESTSTQTGTAIDVNSTTVTDLMKNGAVLLNRRGLSNYFGFLYKSKGILADNLDNNYKIMSGIIDDRS